VKTTPHVGYNARWLWCGTRKTLGIISNTEDCPGEAEKYRKYRVRRERALATIVLAIDTSLLYLLGDPQDPAKFCEELSNQFQKCT